MATRLSVGRNDADIQVIASRCTRGELTAYQQLRYIAITAPDRVFQLAGYIVADATAVETPKHGRRKAYLASLVRKQIIVPLDRSCSRTQRYLIGCITQNTFYYVSWLDEVFDWGRGLALPHEASHQASNRAIRPSRSETPQTLMDKGFVPCHPNRSSSYRLPDEYLSISGEASRPSARKQHAPSRRPAKQKAPSERDRQITQLATAFSRLTGTFPNLSHRFRNVWKEMLSYCGYTETREIMFATWKARARLLNPDFPVLTVHSVKYYATVYWRRDPKHYSRRRRLHWIKVSPMPLVYVRISSLTQADVSSRTLIRRLI
jgi:hypothetical protein